MEASSRMAVCGQPPVSTPTMRSGRQGVGPQQKLRVLEGVDVVGDHGQSGSSSRRAQAQPFEQRRLAGTDRTAHAHAQGLLAADMISSLSGSKQPNVRWRGMAQLGQGAARGVGKGLGTFRAGIGQGVVHAAASAMRPGPERDRMRWAGRLWPSGHELDGRPWSGFPRPSKSRKPAGNRRHPGSPRPRPGQGEQAQAKVRSLWPWPSSSRASPARARIAGRRPESFARLALPSWRLLLPGLAGCRERRAGRRFQPPGGRTRRPTRPGPVNIRASSRPGPGWPARWRRSRPRHPVGKGGGIVADPCPSFHGPFQALGIGKGANGQRAGLARRSRRTRFMRIHGHAHLAPRAVSKTTRLRVPGLGRGRRTAEDRNLRRQASSAAQLRASRTMDRTRVAQPVRRQHRSRHGGCLT